MSHGNHSLFRDTMVAAGLVLSTAMLASGQEEKKPETATFTFLAEGEDGKKEAVEKQLRIRAVVADDEKGVSKKATEAKKQYRFELKTDGEGKVAKPGITAKAYRVEVHSDAKDQGADEKVTIETKGKVVIVGPDGKVQEYDLSELPADIKIPNIEALKTAKIRMRAQAGEAAEKAGNIRKNARIIVTDPSHGKEHNHIFIDEIDVKTLHTGSGFFIGVQLQPLTDALKAQLNTKNGILVESVIEGSAAEKAGVKAFDVIASANGKPVKGHSDLQKAIGDSKGKPVKLGLIRGGKKESLSVTPEKREMKSAQVWVSEGAEMKNVQDILEKLKADGANELNLEVIRPGIILKKLRTDVDIDLADKVKNRALHHLMLDGLDLSKGAPHAIEIHRMESIHKKDDALSGEVKELKKQVLELQKMVKELKASAKKTAERSPKSESRGKKTDRQD